MRVAEAVVEAVLLLRPLREYHREDMTDLKKIYKVLSKMRLVDGVKFQLLNGMVASSLEANSPDLAGVPAMEYINNSRKDSKI